MKPKRKASPIKNKPNPIAHMVLWGFSSGALVSTLFLFWLWAESIALSSNIWVLILQVILIPIFGLFLGGVPGTIIGLLSGWILWLVMWKTLVPFTMQELQNYRMRAYTLVILITGISSFIIMLWFSIAWEGFGTSSPPEFSLVPFIASIAAAYAAHRYLFRLRLWSEQEYGLRREKVKNVEALEDKVKIDEMDFDEAESKKHETS